MATAEETMKDWKIARTGISLLLNNKTEEAETLFTEHPHSFHVKAGRCFVLFMVRNRVMYHIDFIVYSNEVRLMFQGRERMLLLNRF
jgi:hypothetical protein